jgi:Raf kinase inhibitor-like YbhB/YbcL family protein
MDDPDAPGGIFTHWLVWNINPGVKEVSGAPKGAIEGSNDFGKMGYKGPCPPSGVHHYLFKVYGLDVVPAVNPGANRAALEAAMKAHITAFGILQGEYGR